MLETPGISVRVPATKPAVQDSAVATSSFLRLQIASRRLAASTISSSSIARTPGQPHGRRGISRDTFAAAGEAELFAGGCLHCHAVDRDTGERGNLCAHGIALPVDARRFANDSKIEMGDAAATRFHTLDCEGQKAIG